MKKSIILAACITVFGAGFASAATTSAANKMNTQVQADKTKLHQDRKSNAGRSVIKQDKATIKSDRKKDKSGSK